MVNAVKIGARGRQLGFGGMLAGLALVTAACAGGASTTGASDSGGSLKIVSPANGAQVTVPFTLHLEPGAPVGDPSTGKDHVHIGFDGQSVDVERNLVFGNSCTVTNLAPGRHRIEASLRNADHSAAGATDTITVVVTGGAGAGSAGGSGTCGSNPSGSSGGSSGY